MVTNSNGVFTFSAVSSGSYTLPGTKSGYDFSSSVRNATVRNSNIRSVTATSHSYVLTDGVAYNNGTGLANVQGRLGTGQSVFTNSAGYYGFYGVRNGT